MKSAIVLIATLLLLSQTGRAMETKQKFNISSLSWITGNWHGELFGGPSEEHWSEVSGGSMIGYFRLDSPAKFRLMEALMIEQDGDDVFYRFRHFGPKMAPKEETPLTFKMVKLDGQMAIFEGAETQKPMRLIYTRKGDKLNVRVESVVEGKIDGFDAPFTLKKS